VCMLHCHIYCYRQKCVCGRVRFLQSEKLIFIHVDSEFLLLWILQGHNIDQTLTTKQSADTLAFTALLTDKLLPAIVRQHQACFIMISWSCWIVLQ